MSRSHEKSDRIKQLSFHHNDDSDSGSSDGQSSTKNEDNYHKKNIIERTLPVSPSRTTDAKIHCPSKDKFSDNEQTKSVSDSEKISDETEKSMNSRDKQLQEIRSQIQSIKEQLEQKSQLVTLSERRQISQTKLDASQSEASDRSTPPKGAKRERETLDIVSNFRKKMREITKRSLKHRRNPPSDRTKSKCLDDDNLDLVDSDDWLSHKFEADDD